MNREEHAHKRHSRRAFIGAAVSALFSAGCAGSKGDERQPRQKLLKARTSTVTLARCHSYEEDIFAAIKSLLSSADLPDLSGKRVVVKPNMVEYRPDRPVTTSAAAVKAAIELADYLGAREIIVAEGPGHFRDTEFLLEKTGIGTMLAKLGVRFVDLNLDDIDGIENKNGLTRAGRLFLPKTVLDCDALISVPKLKTHHFVGMTASMKNLFGIMPGRMYGWPKNMLHWLGIPETIVDINYAVPPSIALVDAVVAMEGDGPINGVARNSGFLAIGSDCAAVDSTCARAIGIDPARLHYLVLAGQEIGNTDPGAIAIAGAALSSLQSSFEMAPSFRSDRGSAFTLNKES